MILLKILKRPFCKHTFEKATFETKICGQKMIFPCTAINGDTLYECTNCGKLKVVKGTSTMDTKEQLLKECKDLGIINIEADNLTEGLIRDAIDAVKEAEPYVKKAIEEAKRELGDKDV